MSVFDFREKKVRAAGGAVTVKFLVCEPLEAHGFLNAFSTRQAGTSPLPENALNLHFKNDADKNVLENRRRFLSAVGANGRPITTLHQIHSDRHSVINEDFDGEPDGDALITMKSNILIAVKTADCLPILIGDPKTKAMAAIHAGWRGSLSRIAEKMVVALKNAFQSEPSDLVAALGPSACAACYEIGPDVVQMFTNEFKETDLRFLTGKKPSGHAQLNVPMLNVLQLLRAGIKEENIFASPMCTMHDNHLFFSHRRESGGGNAPVGRLLAVIGR